jgi:hypothetical protein
VTYDKGAWVFWMLLQHMGRERALAGVQDFIRRYEVTRDYPVLQDFVAVMREHAADVDAYDAFVRQWFFSVVVSEYKVREARAARLTSGNGSEVPAACWEVSFEIENVGTGTMPVEVAAVRGELPKEKVEGEKSKKTAADPQESNYQEARQTMVLGPGARERVTLTCEFEPERVIVDPDALVPQLNRDQAIADIKIDQAGTEGSRIVRTTGAPAPGRISI